eukprot:5184291-Prymnesium_polylepis.1
MNGLHRRTWCVCRRAPRVRPLALLGDSPCDATAATHEPTGMAWFLAADVVGLDSCTSAARSPVRRAGARRSAGARRVSARPAPCGDLESRPSAECTKLKRKRIDMKKTPSPTTVCCADDVGRRSPGRTRHTRTGAGGALS